MRATKNTLDAAIGLRSHSGWASLVALEGPAENPSVLLRRRIELSQKLPRQPFHAAEGRPFKEAEALIRQATEETRTLASQELRQALAEVGAGRRGAIGCGLLLAAGRPLPALAQILASHALIHAAEGEMFRDALRSASRQCHLHMTEVKERELHDHATRRLGVPPADLNQRLTEWGRALGPPWRQDEKLAALVAWLALIPPGAGDS
jgi:hypothetical protein